MSSLRPILYVLIAASVTLTSGCNGGEQTRDVTDSGVEDVAADVGGDSGDDDAPLEDAAGGDASGEDTPGEDTPGEDTPGEDTPGEDTPGEDTPGEDTPGEDTPAEDTDVSLPDTIGDDAADTPTDEPDGSVALSVTALSEDAGTLLVSNGIPFATGELSDASLLRVIDGDEEISIHVSPLANHPDGSIRAVLIQFERDAAAFPAEVTLEWGVAPEAEALAGTTPSWTVPQAVAFPSAEYLAGSGVAGPMVPAGADERYATYDARQAEGYADLVGSGDWGPDARNDGYYSTTLNWYLHFLRTGDVGVYEWARREAVHYREDQIVHEGDDAGTMNGRSEPRYLFLRAMELDYLLSGDTRTLEIAELMAEYLLEVIDVDRFFYAADSERFWTERRVAFTLLGLVVYGRMSGDAGYLEAAHPRFENLLRTQAEHEDGGFIHHLYAHDSEECGTFGEYGGSPFMTGLLFEALITYYEQFGDERAVDSVVQAVDWLYESGWHGDGFCYLIGCGYGDEDGAPDLNLLIVAGYGFAYWATGDERHRTRGYEVFDEGVAEAYLGARKQFNQNYRSSGWFLGYLAREPR